MNAQQKWTPGPWKVDVIEYPSRRDVSFEINAYDRNGHPTFVTQSHMREIATEAERIALDKANFALIAAAPDLLEAAMAAKKYLEPDLVEPGRTVFWKLVAALAKASQ